MLCLGHDFLISFSELYTRGVWYVQNLSMLLFLQKERVGVGERRSMTEGRQEQEGIFSFSVFTSAF